MNAGKISMRVAVAAEDLASFEGDIARGVIQYNEYFQKWDLVGRNGRPFVAFTDIDLSAVDAVIASLYQEDWIGKARAAGIFLVNTSSEPTDPTIPCVSNDDAAAGRMGAQHLLGCGYRNFGFIKNDHRWYPEQRLIGFLEVIEGQADLPVSTLTIRDENPITEASSIRSWLRNLPKPVAVMTCNDLIGSATINEAVAAGFIVPDDVGVLGCDNDIWQAATARTPLSSVEHAFFDVGYRAAELLHSLMDGNKPPPPLLLTPTMVVQRRSTNAQLNKDPLVTQAMVYIRDHIHEGINVADILHALKCSRKTLESRIKTAAGVTPHHLICRTRIDRAKHMMNSNINLSEIAYACGFYDAARFSKVFKRLTGLTPSEYSQKNMTKNFTGMDKYDSKAVRRSESDNEELSDG
jgi:LacI family transcriptional regulator